MDIDDKHFTDVVLDKADEVKQRLHRIQDYVQRNCTGGMPAQLDVLLDLEHSIVLVQDIINRCTDVFYDPGDGFSDSEGYDISDDPDPNFNG